MGVDRLGSGGAAASSSGGEDSRGAPVGCRREDARIPPFLGKPKVADRMRAPWRLTGGGER